MEKWRIWIDDQTEPAKTTLTKPPNPGDKASEADAMEATASQSQKPDNHLMNICNVGSKGRKHRSRQTKTSDSLSLQTISKPSERLFFDKKVGDFRVQNLSLYFILLYTIFFFSI